jgi:tetratricopeptide (TPR) repeat protein
VDQFSGELGPGQLAGLPTSLPGVVTRSFHLGRVLPARIAAAALPLYLRAIALLRRDTISYREALALLEEASGLDSNSPLIQASMPEGYLQAYAAGKDPRWLRPAEEAARRAQALHPDWVPVLLTLGQLERTAGRLESSIRVFRPATEVEPENSEVWRHLGATHQGVSDYSEAIAALKKAIDLDPAYYAPHTDLGFTYFRMGRYADAAAEYRAVIAAAPDLALGYNYLGDKPVVRAREILNATKKGLFVYDVQVVSTGEYFFNGVSMEVDPR